MTISHNPGIDAPPTSRDKSAPLATDSRMMIHMPVDVRSASLAFVAVAVGIALLRWTQEFIVPVLLGVVLSYALTPLVERFERLRVPRMVGAGLVLTLILGALAAGGYALRDQAAAFVSALPTAAQQVRRAISSAPGEEEGALAKVQRAATELEASGKTGDRPPPLRRRHRMRSRVSRRLSRPMLLRPPPKRHQRPL